MKTTHTFLALCVGYIILFSSPKSFSQYPTPPERPYKAYSRNGDNTGWTVMPVRSKEEFDLHLAGGGSHQIMHGMVRCNQHPEIVYALQDISGPWRSIDGGKSWTKPRAMGLIAVYGQSIAVDPVNPARVLVSTYHPWDGGLPEGKGMNDHAGIYLSDDYGESFTLVLNKPDFGFNWFLHRGYNENLAYSPASIDEQGAGVWYAAFHGKGFYQSTDYGASWHLKNALDDQEIIYEIEVHPTHPDTIYLACGKGLYYSYDGGTTFDKNTSLPDDYDASYNAYTANGPFNNGVSSIEIDPRNPTHFWVTRLLQYDRNTALGESSISVSVVGLGLYKTENDGANFSKIEYTSRTGGDEQPFRIFQSPSNPNWLYVSVLDRYYISEDNGQTWQRISQTGSRAPGLNRYPYARISGMSAAFVPSALDSSDVVAHGEATFFASNDGGYNPHEANSFFTGIAWGNGASSIAFNPNNSEQFAFFACDVGMRLTSNGGDWFTTGQPVREVFESYGISTSYQGQTSGTFDIQPGSKTLISTIGQYSKSWLVRSDNLGELWSMYDEFSSQTHNPHRLLAWHPTDRNIIFSSNKISRDGGDTFVPLPQIHRDPDDESSPLYSISIAGFSYHHPETVYAVSNNRIYRSDETAADNSWIRYIDLSSQGVDLSPIDASICFAVDPFDPDIIYFLGQNGDFGKYDGETLQLTTGLINLAQPVVEGNCVLSIATDPKHKGVVYAATAFPGTCCVFRSDNYGSTWTDITGNLPYSGLLSSQIIVNPHTGELFRGGPFGTWVYTHPGINNGDDATELQTNGIKLYDPYPNPSSSLTCLSYSLDSPSKVQISVFDIAGREIEVISTDGKVTGLNEIHFDISGYTKGLYLVTLKVNNQPIDTKKLLVK